MKLEHSQGLAESRGRRCNDPMQAQLMRHAAYPLTSGPVIDGAQEIVEREPDGVSVLRNPKIKDRRWSTPTDFWGPYAGGPRRQSRAFSDPVAHRRCEWPLFTEVTPATLAPLLDRLADEAETDEPEPDYYLHLNARILAYAEATGTASLAANSA